MSVDSIDTFLQGISLVDHLQIQTVSTNCKDKSRLDEILVLVL